MKASCLAVRWLLLLLSLWEWQGGCRWYYAGPRSTVTMAVTVTVTVTLLAGGSSRRGDLTKGLDGRSLRFHGGFGCLL